MSRLLGILVGVTTAAPLTFTHLDTTWTIELHEDEGELHVTADCPDTRSWHRGDHHSALEDDFPQGFPRLPM